MLRPYVRAGLAAVFVLVLLYVTLRSTPTPLGDDREALVAATRECQRAVQESVPDARFPFEANMSDLPGDQVRLSGSIDTGDGLETQRRNYLCYVSVPTGSRGYVADSIEVWTSH